MKLRLGFVSAHHSYFDDIRKEFSDMYLTTAKNVIDLAMHLPAQPLDAIVIYMDKSEVAQWQANYQFIRSKSALKQTPIAILAKEHLTFPHVITDSLIRQFTTETGLLIPLLDFFKVAQDPQILNKMITTEKIESWFLLALEQKLGAENGFTSHEANDDEAREAYLSQLNDEISTNLMWVKFSARILEKGSHQLKSNYSNMSDSELDQVLQKILEMSFTAFDNEAHQHISAAGAVNFFSTEQLPPTEKSPYIKKAKSKSIIFESPVCRILLEVIRYI